MESIAGLALIGGEGHFSQQRQRVGQPHYPADALQLMRFTRTLFGETASQASNTSALTSATSICSRST